MNRTLRNVAVAAALIGVPLAGASLAPNFASAQDTPAEEAPAPDGETAPDGEERPGEGCRGHRGPKLDAAAEAIGIERDALAEALRSGETIADVAAANGVEVQTVIDAMVTAANERLDEAVADEKLTEEEAAEKRAELEQRITDAVNGELPEGGPRGPRPDGDPQAQSSGFPAPQDTDEVPSTV